MLELHFQRAEKKHVKLGLVATASVGIQRHRFSLEPLRMETDKRGEMDS